MWAQFQHRLSPMLPKKKITSRNKKLSSDPVELVQSPNFVVGVAKSKGQRDYMEDRILISKNMLIPGFSILSPQTLFAVMDGHGGEQASNWLCNNFADELKSHLAAVSYEYMQANIQSERDHIIIEAIEASFYSSDKRLKEDDTFQRNCGSCISGALFIGTQLYVFNLGDSRTLLCRNGTIIYETYDHKPDNPVELARISESGGIVLHGRVMGELAVSRAFGNFHLKYFSFDHSGSNNEGKNVQNNRSAISLYPPSIQTRLHELRQYESEESILSNADELSHWISPLVTTKPDVSGFTLTNQDEFMIIASDGLFEVISNDEAISFVSRRLQRKLSHGLYHRFLLNSQNGSSKKNEELANDVCNDLITWALKRGSQDNITVILVMICAAANPEMTTRVSFSCSPPRVATNDFIFCSVPDGRISLSKRSLSFQG